jgi:uncharacterized membrane protein HdeD (DUF308 family)
MKYYNGFLLLISGIFILVGGMRGKVRHAHRWKSMIILGGFFILLGLFNLFVLDY